MSDSRVLDAVREYLNSSGVTFREKQHQPTFTSAESAEARGESLSIGAKALVVKADDGFCILVLPADRKLDSRAAKRNLDAKKIRFATADELRELTGLAPGSVPPFGPPVLALPLYADSLICRNEQMAFNAGSLTDSIIMSTTDYRRIVGATWVDLAEAK
jgi:prolyl-tRNA editing enzyme YbaK/EbsC (Cys-tRNA(Pro) deacylase)